MFSVGDLVQLKSGGAHMVVTGVDTTKSEVQVVWLTKDDYVQRAAFNFVVVIPVVDTP